MSYRLLLAGKKQDIIDNFFQMADYVNAERRY